MLRRDYGKREYQGFRLQETTGRNLVEIQRSPLLRRFAPMLCVLFIATRMRALQISKNKGAPQGWAQDGMSLALCPASKWPATCVGFSAQQL